MGCALLLQAWAISTVLCVSAYSGCATIEGELTLLSYPGVRVSASLLADDASVELNVPENWLPANVDIFSNTLLHVQVTNTPGRGGFAHVSAPIWVLFSSASTLLLAVFLSRLHRSRKRASEGTCKCCGYDLRGTPSDVCSECGTKQPFGNIRRCTDSNESSTPNLGLSPPANQRRAEPEPDVNTSHIH
jgi:hypothetical protein